MIEQVREELRLLGRVAIDYAAHGVSVFVVLLLASIRRRLQIGKQGAQRLEVQNINKESDMLEGKEVDLAIGSIGHASVDLNDKGELEVALSAKIDILAELHKLAAKSGTKLDDMVIEALEKLLGKA